MITVSACWRQAYSQAKIIGLVTQAPPHSTRKTLSPSLLLLAPLAQLQGLPSKNAETGDPKLTLPGSQSVARRREERILTLASLSIKPSPGWGPGAQTHADPAVKATAAFPSLTRPDSQTGARRRDEETPHPRPFILQAVVRGGGQGGQTNVDPTGRNLGCFPEQRPREGLLTMQDARFRRHIRPTGVHGSSLADRHVPQLRAPAFLVLGSAAISRNRGYFVPSIHRKSMAIITALHKYGNTAHACDFPDSFE
ncbi:hypothetical protein NDU88_006209 [Pleurodeles waltl]|uniref:Uncharacterized protein n=1 Tax=Pleurodeles waltl TaxID=8319 RepID=A0AAV7TCY2_PLEWA|nr:hypothetical protein NDU88_006209 [Pleurodeles waltl]